MTDRGSEGKAPLRPMAPPFGGLRASRPLTRRSETPSAPAPGQAAVTPAQGAATPAVTATFVNAALPGLAGVRLPKVESPATVVAAAARAPGVALHPIVETALGVEAIGGSPEDFARFIDAELARWGEAVRRSGARLD